MGVMRVRLHLLIVDDDEMACLGLQNRLKDIAFSHQMEISAVHSAEEALQYARWQSVDILLTDIHPRLLSIIITAYPTFPYAHQAIQLGVVGFLLKPVARDEMCETIQKAVGRAEEQRLGAATLPVAQIDGGADPVAWAKTYVQQHLSDEINMALVANMLNLSYSYFSKLFKKETGQTFTQYIVDVKMQAAASMLLAGKRTSEIAAELGYLAPQNFNRAFLNYWRCTPGEYRKAHRKLR